MTTTGYINGGAQIVWPEQSSDDYLMEHAVTIAPYSDCIQLEQNGKSIIIPLYALAQVLRAMRAVGKTAEDMNHDNQD